MRWWVTSPDGHVTDFDWGAAIRACCRHGATRDFVPVTPRLIPDLAGTVAPPALAVSRLDLLEVHSVLPGAVRGKPGIARDGGMAMEGRRGDLQNTADRLDPETRGGSGIFARIMLGLAAEHGERKTVMIDATYLKAHRTASSLGVKKGGRTTGAGA